MSMSMRMSSSTRAAVRGSEWQNLLVPLRQAA